jgi:multidrug resistance efflux pump
MLESISQELPEDISASLALANLQASCDLKIARIAALEAELRSLSAEIEADKKKIAELPGLIEKTQEKSKIGYSQDGTMRRRTHHLV